MSEKGSFAVKPLKACEQKFFKANHDSDIDRARQILNTRPQAVNWNSQWTIRQSSFELLEYMHGKLP